MKFMTVEKADFSKSYQNTPPPQKKTTHLVTTHFSEISELKYGKGKVQLLNYL